MHYYYFVRYANHLRYMNITGVYARLCQQACSLLQMRGGHADETYCVWGLKHGSKPLGRQAGGTHWDDKRTDGQNSDTCK